ncbi:MAG TPA: hypothetical protein VJ482_05975 [Acidimicrobiia bacterium]|nr:hypothetical protein [Acidimicrobiia bacterium]
MPKLVGVFNAPPVYATGLAGALAPTGYSLEEVSHPLPWLKQHRGAAVLVGVRVMAEFDVVIELKAEDPQSIVVTLLNDESLETVEASLRAGASASVALDAKADEVALTLHAAMLDRTSIPIGVARTMAGDSRPRTQPDSIGDAELSWLRDLAAGKTVADLAGLMSYSEREMYRRLQRVYARIGANGRTDALLRVARWGLLDDLRG